MKAVHAALADGECVCVFPEGLSRYQSGLAPLKRGVARIALQAMKEQCHRPEFSVQIVCCALTYWHRVRIWTRQLLIRAGKVSIGCGDSVLSANCGGSRTCSTVGSLQ